MCFSAKVSFLAATVILPLGIYGFVKTLKWHNHYLLLSLIPIMFSIQQFTEGMIWLEWQHEAFTAMLKSGLHYAFFAFFVWPVYLPLSAYYIETVQIRKRVMGVLTLAGFIYGCMVYLPLILGDRKLSISVINQSIVYDIDQSTFTSWVYGGIYAIITILPFLCSSKKEIKLLGIWGAFSLAITVIFYYHALTSVWCFFAAFLSCLIVYCIHKAEPKIHQNH